MDELNDDMLTVAKEHFLTLVNVSKKILNTHNPLQY